MTSWATSSMTGMPGPSVVFASMRTFAVSQAAQHPSFSRHGLPRPIVGAMHREQVRRATAVAAGAGAAIARGTPSVSTGAAGGSVTEKPARCGHRLRAAQLGRPDALGRRRPEAARASGPHNEREKPKN